MQDTTPTDSTLAAQPIVARAGSYYRNMRYLMFVLLVAMGAWFGYDGFHAWPEGNRRIAELELLIKEADGSGDIEAAGRHRAELKNYKKRSDTDLLIQKVLCFALPVLGGAVLLNALRRSRGEIRLEDDVLHAPGHEPLPLEHVQQFDRRLWDRKGIAFVQYDRGGVAARIRLDDFIYERKPIDAIHDRICDVLNLPRSSRNAPAARSAEAGGASAPPSA